MDGKRPFGWALLLPALCALAAATVPVTAAALGEQAGWPVPGRPE